MKCDFVGYGSGFVEQKVGMKKMKIGGALV